MFKKTILYIIIFTKLFNFNNNIVIKRSKAFYLSRIYLKQMMLLKRIKSLIKRLNNLRIYQIEIFEIFEKILDNNVSTKKIISTLNINHEMFN